MLTGRLVVWEIGLLEGILSTSLEGYNGLKARRLEKTTLSAWK